MDKEKLEQLEEIRSRYEARLDGSSSSGNWGHVGRPGKKGGSAPGGGGAFRLTLKKERKNGEKYTSQAKQRKEALGKVSKAKKQLSKAQESGNEKKIERAQRAVNRAEKHASKINTKQKTRASLHNYDPEASKNILKDTKGRGRMVTETRTTGVRGTKEAVEYTYPNRIKDGAKTTTGKRSGKPKQSVKSNAGTKGDVKYIYTKTGKSSANKNTLGFKGEQKEIEYIVPGTDKFQSIRYR